MKLCWNSDEEAEILKSTYLRTYLIVAIWMCGCYRGDEARPARVIPPIACEDIIGEPSQGISHATESCNWCKCSIRCKDWSECLNLNLRSRENLLSAKPSPVLDLLNSSCKACCNRNPPILSIGFECEEVEEEPDDLIKCHSLVSECCWLLCSSERFRRRCFYFSLRNITHSITPSKILTEHFEEKNKDVSEIHQKSRKRRTSSGNSSSTPPFRLRLSSETLPISPRENETFSPAAGVIIYDETTNRPASKEILSRYTWNATIRLLYDIYPGQLLGQTAKVVRNGKSEILFEDIVITEWGYSYLLQIELEAKYSDWSSLTTIIGPFDVDMLDTFEQPLVDSDEFRDVKIIFEGKNNQNIKKDERKFRIFFLNKFGRKYSRVRWKNVTLLKGSLVVNSIITGLAKDLDFTSQELSDDIERGEADITYEGHILRASRVFLPSRKLLEETSTEDEGGGGGLSVAWIVAIVVNVVLILAFIIAIVYCYCRRKRQRDVTRSNTSLRKFHGGPDPLLFANKAENLPDKAAIFTVEDRRARMEEEEDEDYDRKCNCVSPKCYCSVGDGRQSDMSLRHREENEEDPQGYPTPSPEPKFPTPEPTPEPESYWRPDSTPQPEEEEPEEDLFLPGAVSEPTPEPQEERFYVYLLTDIDGSRELIGQIYLTIDCFLNDVRRSINRDRDLSEAIGDREYRFLDENLDGIPQYQESSMELERVFPSQGINIQFLPRKIPTPEPQIPRRPQVPAYVGPLGICNAAQCTKAAKIKCLDCRNVAYCSKRCMREDIKDHKRACYKPAWRL